MVNGLDVSDYQPNVNWKAVRSSGYSFAYSKATEGTGFTSSTYAQNAVEARNAGLRFGAYHFFRFDQDAMQQANHFLATARVQKGDLPPALDIEDDYDGITAEQRISAISSFLHVVESSLQVKCLLYIGYYYWQDKLGGTDGFSGHPLWCAGPYDYDAVQPEGPSLVPAVWSKWLFWQYSDKKQIGGVPGGCDANLFNGDLTALESMTLR